MRIVKQLKHGIIEEHFGYGPYKYRFIPSYALSRAYRDVNSSGHPCLAKSIESAEQLHDQAVKELSEYLKNYTELQ